MKALRLSLKMSISEFGRMLGMNLPVIQSREYERVPWQSGEIESARGKVIEHLREADRTLANLGV